MATLFNTFPKHASVFNLFQQPQPQFEHAPATTSMSPHDEDVGDMDESFGLPDVSIDALQERDVSFASTISLNSPLSPPSFQQMESSPYGMDICSPSPGHPHYGKRIVAQTTIVDSGCKVFGQHLAPQPAFMLPARNQTPGGLLKRLTANVEDTGFSPMSIGSVRSTGTNRSGTGKVGSIKSISSIKDNDAASKARARSRGALPASWMNHSRAKSEAQQNAQPVFDQQKQYPLEELDAIEDAIEDVSMEDAMEVDSPLAARRPPKAQVRPRPLSLFIPSTARSPILSQQEELEESPALKSALTGRADQFAAHFIDTPEPAQRTAMPHFVNNDGSSVNESPFHRPFGGSGFGRPADSSPVASPSAQKYERCLSAGIPPSSSSSSSSTGFLSIRSGSSRGPLSANLLLNGRKTSTITSSTRIPSLKNRSLSRPGLSTALQDGSTESHEARSANIVPSARMASLNPRRAVSAFIQPDQLHSAPFSGTAAGNVRTVGSRVGINGVAKGRVVSMLLPNTGDDDDGSSGTEGMFSSPSAARGVGNAHRRMRSNGSSIRDAAVGYQTGSMRIRSSLQQQQQQVDASAFATLRAGAADPSPLRPLLPFGDGEHSGKILPCHSVKEDGLMRITPATLQALLSGAYDAHVASYRVIDCRFAYEFVGGHIRGAINLNKDEDIERFLFEEASRCGELPPPSQSGTPGFRQPILVFHCEFSAKRGPTFAKHFRAKDRARNLPQYPKLHYPELYILEGGYCSYFSAYPETCEPHGYVQMDAPQHSQARAADLGQFRRWNRARSYTYGDSQGPTQTIPQPIRPSGSADNNQYARNSVTLGARRPASTVSHQQRQSYHSLHTLKEDHNQLEEVERQAMEENTGYSQADEQDEEQAAPSDGALTENEDVAQSEVEGEEQELLDEASFGESYSDDVDNLAAPSPSPSAVVEEQQPQEEEDDEYGNFESSPCVTAEMKRGKSRGKQFFQRTFKPLSFGKPFGLSLVPPNQPRGMTRAVSHAV